MRLRYAAILIAGISSLAVAGAVVADGMPTKKAKAAAVKVNPKKKSTRVYNDGLRDESWEIADELNRQEWMRHRYGEGHQSHEEESLDVDGEEDVVVERHHGRHGDRMARFEMRHRGHEAAPLPPLADLPPPPEVDDLPPPHGHHVLPPPPVAERPLPPADLPPPPRAREHRHEFAKGGNHGQRRANVYVFRDSHSAAERRSERYVNGRGGGRVQGHVDGQAYGYSWGDGDRYGAARRAGAGSYSERSYSREESETSSFRGSGYAQSYGYARGTGFAGGQASGYGHRYIPPYGVVHRGRYSSRDADGYLTWPGKR